MRHSLTEVEDGSFVHFLNSGDVLASRGVIAAIRESVTSKPFCHWAMGAVGLFHGSWFDWYQPPLDPAQFMNGLKSGEVWLPHPSTIGRVEDLVGVSAFQDPFRISADYAAGVRMALRFGPPNHIEGFVALHDYSGLSSHAPTRARLENSAARVRAFGLGSMPNEFYRCARTCAAWARSRWWPVTPSVPALHPMGVSLPPVKVADHYCEAPRADTWPWCCLTQLDSAAEAILSAASGESA
jgi:hypothetical protein